MEEKERARRKATRTSHSKRTHGTHAQKQVRTSSNTCETSSITISSLVQVGRVYKIRRRSQFFFLQQKLRFDPERLVRSGIGTIQKCLTSNRFDVSHLNFIFCSQYYTSLQRQVRSLYTFNHATGIKYTTPYSQPTDCCLYSLCQSHSRLTEMV